MGLCSLTTAEGFHLVCYLFAYQRFCEQTRREGQHLANKYGICPGAFLNGMASCSRDTDEAISIITPLIEISICLGYIQCINAMFPLCRND